MKILNTLLLEDEGEFAKSVVDSLYPHIVEWADNLIDFNSLLYEDPKVRAYDLVFLDLHLDIPDSHLELLLGEVPQMKDFTACTVRSIPLYGLDYFKAKVLTDSTTKDIAKEKFVLLSGHARIVRMEALFEKHRIDFPYERLLDKAVIFNKRLKEFITLTD